MKGRRLMGYAVVGAVVLVVVAAAFIMKPRPVPVRLADGTLIELTRLKLGTSNAFVHGSALERLLGSTLPTNGWQVSRVRLNRPVTANEYGFRASTLSMEFRMSGAPVDNGTSPILNNRLHREFRLVISGEDKVPYVEEFLRNTRYHDGVYIYVNSTSFPRSSRVLHFRLQQHDEALGPWRTVAEFHRTNPARDEARNWPAEQMPVKRLTNGVELLMDRIAMSPHDSNPWGYFWQATLSIPFQVRVDGVLRTNWTLHEMNGEDTSGNTLFLGTSRRMEYDWSVLRGFRSLDPHKVWRLRAQLAPESEFAPNELFTFEVSPALSGTNIVNIGADRLKVSWVNRNTLAVELVDEPEGKRLIFVDAQDGQGQSIREHSGSWGRTRFWRTLKLAQTSSSIRTTIAVTRNIPIEVFVQPRYMGSAHK